MVYRNIALDLIPGRVENASVISAPQDWYRTYVQAGGLKSALRKGYDESAVDPRVKGFKSKRVIGPIARVVR